MDLNLPGGDLDVDEQPLYTPRRAPRVGVSASTRLRSNDQAVSEVTVCDLSTSGFMAECMRPILIGSYVSLDLPGIGPVHAQVRWQIGPRLGARFLDPISLHRCAWTTGGAAV
jgi:hypothetical protein